MSNIALVALAAIVPLVVLMLTSFVKVSVVLALLRNAIGAPDAPSGLVVMGVSLVLTFFVMAPVAVDMVRAASGPAAPTAPTAQTAPTPPTASELDQAVRELVPPPYHAQLDAAERSLDPLRGWLAKHASPRDRASFVDVAQRAGRTVRGDELWVLAPAFLASELREAFAIAVLLFVPFLVLDLVVGLGLAALGLHTTSPQVVALPLKLLLFVSVDGWRLLLESLLRGYT